MGDEKLPKRDQSAKSKGRFLSVQSFTTGIMTSKANAIEGGDFNCLFALPNRESTWLNG